MTEQEKIKFRDKCAIAAIAMEGKMKFLRRIFNLCRHDFTTSEKVIAYGFTRRGSKFVGGDPSCVKINYLCKKCGKKESSIVIL